MTVIGVDTSSKTIHLVALKEKDGAVDYFHSIKTEAIDIDARLTELFEQFSTYVKGLKITPRLLVVENAIYIQNIKATLSIANTVTSVKVVSFMNGIPFMSVDVKHWKKAVLGDGNSNKEKIKAFSLLRWKQDWPDQDFHDAACIALWAWWRVGAKNGKEMYL